MRRFNFAEILLALFVLLYFGLFAFNSLMRARCFSPDSLNYVDVANNLSEGRGLVQSTLGFNDPRFLGDQKIPTPFVAQPPLYPILIAGLAKLGLSIEDAALLIPAVCLLLIIVLAHAFTRKVYGQLAAFIVTVFLILSFPLRISSRCAWSDVLGCVMILLTFLTLISAKQRLGFFALAGLTTGAAFATRYALAPLFVVGLFYIGYYLKDRHAAFSYVAGFILIAAPILLRNEMVAGRFFPLHNPSDITFFRVISDAFNLLFAQYFNLFSARREKCIFAVTILIAALALKNKTAALKELFVENGRFLLPLWTAVYLGFIIWQRSKVHFDELSPRLILPAGIPLMILWAAWLGKGLERYSRIILCTVLLALYPIYQEVTIARGKPAATKEERVEASIRLHWMEHHTTDRDLIIGDDVVDVPFYFGYKTAVSFSPYPYSQYPTYEALMEFLKTQKGQYEHFYLIMRNRCRTEADWNAFFGPFVAELMHGHDQPFPGIVLKEALQGSTVFEIFP